MADYLKDFFVLKGDTVSFKDASDKTLFTIVAHTNLHFNSLDVSEVLSRSYSMFRRKPMK